VIALFRHGTTLIQHPHRKQFRQLLWVLLTWQLCGASGKFSWALMAGTPDLDSAPHCGHPRCISFVGLEQRIVGLASRRVGCANSEE
jgi:hypothetical protein